MSKFLSSVLKLSTATLAGQILGILLTPILSRLYTPADFGTFQLFVSIVAIIAIIACLSYHSAILLPKDDEDAANIVMLCIILIIISSIVATIIFFVVSDPLEQILHEPGLSDYLLLLPFAILSNSLAYVLGYWLSRREAFGTIAKSNIASSIAGKGVSVGWGFISPSPWGLIIGTLVNDATIALICLKRSLRDFPLFWKTSFDKMKQLARRYENFPRYTTGSNLANMAGTQATPFLLAFFFSPVIVGFYAMAHMIIMLPSKMVGSSIATVFFQKASVDKNNNGQITNIVRIVHTRLVSIGMFLCLMLIIIGPELFVVALGAQWFTAGVYAQILAPWFFVAFISTPLFSIFNVLEKQVVSLWFNLLLFISRIAALFIGGFFNNPVLGMVLLSSTGVIFWSWMNMYLLKISGVSVIQAIYDIGRNFLVCIVVCLPLLVAKFYSISSVLLILIAIILLLFYYISLVYRDPLLKQELDKYCRAVLLKVR